MHSLCPILSGRSVASQEPITENYPSIPLKIGGSDRNAQIQGRVSTISREDPQIRNFRFSNNQLPIR